jgi:hypothetical protein
MAFSTGSIVDVPFELWHVGIGTYDDASDDYRMIPLVFDEDGNDLFNLMAIDHSVSGGDNDPYTDWVYWYTPTDVTPGSVGYDAWVNSGFDGNLVDTEVMARTGLVNWNGGSVADATFPANVDAVMPEEGTVFRIVSSKPNQAETVFQLEAPGVLNTTEQAKKDVEKINVFPNPYYAYNPEETNRFNRFVTFTHLPQNATLRIFSLSGVQVRKLEKNNESQFLQWDLQNESTLPVASGVYVVHIDMPDLGMQKVLKVFVVQGAEILDYF